MRSNRQAFLRVFWPVFLAATMSTTLLIGYFHGYARGVVDGATDTETRLKKAFAEAEGTITSDIVASYEKRLDALKMVVKLCDGELTERIKRCK